MQLADWLVYPVNLTPHGYCLLWAPGLIWLHAASDIVIGIAYFSIPLALFWFARQRQDLEFRWVIWLFVAFILACGLTHFLSVYTLWVPAYGLEGLVKATTALLSVATALLLWPLVPKLLAIPSPAQLATLNASLSDKIAEQEQTYRALLATQAEVRRANLELEDRVSQRTADLTRANAQLTATLAELSHARSELEETVHERTEALKQRDLLLREVYHRVKNTLQMVDSMLLIQSNTLADPAARAFLESLRGRIYTMGLVHQQLMTSSDLQTFDLEPFLRELTENLVLGSAAGAIEFEVDAFPLSVGLDYALPMGLIVTELVTNSLKHAFPDGQGRVTVSVAAGQDEAATDQIVVTVTDNGAGDPGPSPERPQKGIGKRLVEGLLRQLKGRMVVERQNGVMTRLFLPHPRTI